VVTHVARAFQATRVHHFAVLTFLKMGRSAALGLEAITLQQFLPSVRGVLIGPRAREQFLPAELSGSKTARDQAAASLAIGSRPRSGLAIAMPSPG
jgi:hypothetical protein